MEGKLKRIRFNKDGTLDFDIETENGKRAIVKGCSFSSENWQKKDKTTGVEDKLKEKNYDNH